MAVPLALAAWTSYGYVTRQDISIPVIAQPGVGHAVGGLPVLLPFPGEKQRNFGMALMLVPLLYGIWAGLDANRGEAGSVPRDG